MDNQIKQLQQYIDNSKNTHPAIVDEETFMLVQELREHRRRPTKSGIVSMFSGLLYCADCGEKLYYSVTNNYKREQDYFFCSSYRKNSDVCSAHYIREKVVEEIVLESMQRVFWYVQSFEKDFARKQMTAFGKEKRKELSEKRRELAQAKKRVTQLTELTPEIVHEFIEKIVVSKPEYRDGKRYQTLEIYYNGVGIVREPTPEEMEELFQERLESRKSVKTA